MALTQAERDGARAAVRELYISTLGRDPLTSSANNQQWTPGHTLTDESGLDFWTGSLVHLAETYNYSYALAATREGFRASAEYLAKHPTGGNGVTSQAAVLQMPAKSDFDEVFYLVANPDVASYMQAHPQTFESGYAHFSTGGAAEGRHWRRKSDGWTFSGLDNMSGIPPAAVTTPAPINTGNTTPGTTGGTPTGTVTPPAPAEDTIFGVKKKTALIVGVGAAALFVLSKQGRG